LVIKYRYIVYFWEQKRNFKNYRNVSKHIGVKMKSQIEA